MTGVRFYFLTSQGFVYVLQMAVKEYTEEEAKGLTKQIFPQDSVMEEDR